MTELTNTQRAILAAAAERPGLQILPLPDRIEGGAAKKDTTALLARGFIREDGDSETLLVTDAVLRAIGVTPTPTEPSASIAGPDEPDAPKTTTPNTRPGTKQATLIAMLDAPEGAMIEAPEGATIAEIAAATGWQHHTVRGAIAGARKKRLGLDFVFEKVERRGRVYRLAHRANILLC